MKTSNIKYNLSTDYKRLYELLLKGFLVIGFVSTSKDFSKLIAMEYSKEYNKFDLGYAVVFEDQIKDSFEFATFCKSENIRFFDIV